MEQLRRVTRRDVRLASAIMGAIGAAYTVDAFLLPIGNPVGTGSGAMPTVVGLLWVFCGAYLTVWPPEITQHDDEVGTWPTRDMIVRVAVVLCICFGVIIVLPKLGITVTSAIFMALMARIAGASWLNAILSSIVLAAAIWVVFVYLLDLTLPVGTWMTLIWGG